MSKKHKNGKHANGNGKDPEALSPQQLVFVQAYVANRGNATRAALAAYPDMTEQSAAVQGWRLLRIAKVRTAIDAGRLELLERLKMEGDEALALLAIRARADLADALDEDGRFLPLRYLPLQIRLCVKGVKRNAKGERELVFHDALKATELVAIATGKLRSKLDVDHTFNHLELLAGLDKPPAEDK